MAHLAHTLKTVASQYEQGDPHQPKHEVGGHDGGKCAHLSQGTVAIARPKLHFRQLSPAFPSSSPPRLADSRWGVTQHSSTPNKSLATSCSWKDQRIRGSGDPLGS
eukprot:COSAG01_NODE_2737_length_7163_cov_3.140572_4_plen_106_part_00